MILIAFLIVNSDVAAGENRQKSIVNQKKQREVRQVEMKTKTNTAIAQMVIIMTFLSMRQRKYKHIRAHSDELKVRNFLQVGIITSIDNV